MSEEQGIQTGYSQRKREKSLEPEEKLERPGWEADNTAGPERDLSATAFKEQASQFAEEEVPEKYGVDKLVLMVRDPSWVYAYWEITPEKHQEGLSALELEEGESPANVLRVYEGSPKEEKGGGKNREAPVGGDKPEGFFDIHTGGEAQNWYFQVKPNAVYYAEAGLLAGDGRFHSLVRSNVIRTPRAGMSEITDEEWGTIGQEYYNELYALSGGLDVGRSSLELQRMLEERLRSEMGSGAVSSFGGSPVKKKEKERGFWFVLNTELVVYGATAPDADVTVQGRQVKLRPDGSFTLRFALPDGIHRIDATARSADGIEERTIIPTVSRTTEVPPRKIKNEQTEQDKK